MSKKKTSQARNAEDCTSKAVNKTSNKTSGRAIDRVSDKATDSAKANDCMDCDR